MASVIGVGPWLTGEDRNGRSGRRTGRQGAGPAACLDRLIEQDVIPRLLVAHTGLDRRYEAASTEIGDDEIAAFAPLAVSLEAHELLAEVEAFVHRGLSVERVFVELLAPAARRLGEDWTADRLDFLDVTMGLWRLQEVLREITAASPAPGRQGASRRVLFAPVPGDQHSFGSAMMDECFTRAGWESDLLIEPTQPMLLARVANTAFDIVGLTVSCDCHIGRLPALIVAIRNVSKNPNLRVLLGGRVLIEDPDLALRVGSDGTAATAIDALELADRLLIAIPTVAFA